MTSADEVIGTRNVAMDNTHALCDDPDRNASILVHSGRALRRPDDIADAVIFLASAASDQLHGTIVPVDGGRLGR